MDSLLITICARGGSKGIKNKNIKKLNGQPLICYTINQAKKWGKAKHIVVTTDSLEIAEIAKQAGAEVPFIRPSELATDTAGKIPVLKHALISSEKLFNEKFPAVMDLDVTSPIRKIEDLENVYQLFLRERPKNLFSVIPSYRNPYFNMVEEGGNNRVHLCKKGNFARRQDAPKVYDMNASIYVYDRNFLLEGSSENVITDDSMIYLMGEESKDIDSELDFKFIEFLIKEKIIKL